MKQTLDDRLYQVNPHVPAEPCAWCGYALGTGEGMRLRAANNANATCRFCDRTCAEEYEADRISRYPKAKAKRDDAQARVRELEAEVERLREDATLGADLRCVLESGFEVEVNRGEWSICIERWSPFAPLAETAAVVREWQEGQKPEPAPTPEDAARARIAAAGANVIGKWGVITSDGCEIWLTYPCNDGYALTELAAFAEAHRAAQEPPGAAQ